MAHGLEFLLPVLQAAFEVGDGAAGVFEIQPHVLAGFLIFLELDPAVGPEGDFLGEPLVDGGKRLVHMGDAALGDFLEVLGHERRGGEGEGSLLLVGANPGRGEHVLEQRPVGSRQAVPGRGAVPSRQTMAEPSGATRTNCRRLERTWPSPDLISWVSRKSSHGSSPIVGRVDEDGALAEQVAVLFQQHVADGEHERMAGMDHARRRARPGLSSGRTASLVKQTRS